MAGSSIPGGDAEFGAWLENFLTYATANVAALGLVDLELVPLRTARTMWRTAYPAQLTAQAAAQAARSNVEAALRPLVRRLQSSAAVSDAERAGLGLTVPDRQPTPVSPPTTPPVVKVTVSRLRHVIHFTDAAAPTKKAKPAGVNGAEIWVKLAAVADPPPTDPKALTFVALDTRTPYTLDFDGADGGKNAHYMLRWVTTKGEKGPWSETATATVGA